MWKVGGPFRLSLMLSRFEVRSRSESVPSTARQRLLVNMHVSCVDVDVTVMMMIGGRIVGF